MTTAPLDATPRDYVADGIHLIDCDSHWTEPPDLWSSRAPARYAELAPRVRRMDNGEDRWFIGDRQVATFPGTVVDREGLKFENGTFIKSYDRAHEATFDATARVAYLDEQGIWAQIVYPNVAGFSGSLRWQEHETEDFRRFVVQAYNDAAAELQETSGGRLLPMALLPLWDVDQTVAEMRRAHEQLDLRGFVIGDSFSMGLRDFTDPQWAPFWAYANDARIPLNLHIGSNAVNVIAGIWPTYELPGLERPGIHNMTGQYLAMSSVLPQMGNGSVMANFLFSELFDRYPELRIVSVESGIGWIPYFLEACDWQFEETVLPPSTRRGKLRPSEYFRKHWYATFWFERFGPEHMIDAVGVENVLVETDFPHPTCLYPNSREHFNAVTRGWDDHTRQRVLQDNAAELYRIALP